MSTDYHAKLYPSGFYHIYNKAVSERKLFYEDADYKRFLSKFKNYFSPYLDTFAYCLIPNHFHFLIQIMEKNENFEGQLKKENTSVARKLLSGNLEIDDLLSDQFRRFLSSHSLYVNKKYNFNGPLLLKKMKKTEIKSEVKLYDLLCYIHHNPIHHGLSKSYEDWPYSSYMEFLNKSKLVATDKILDELGNGSTKRGRSAYIKLHEEFKWSYK